MKAKDITNKKSYEKFESINTVLAQLAKSAPDKGNECINIMKNLIETKN